jgi:hypothetical protein
VDDGARKTSTVREIIATSHEQFQGDIRAKTEKRSSDIATEAARILNTTYHWQG